MKRIILLSLLFVCATCNKLVAKDGYTIHLKMKDVADGVVYLATYNAKPLPNIYPKDSAILKDGNAVFHSTDPNFLGGIYIILLSDRRTYFELLLDKGDDFNINVKSIPDKIKYENSPANDVFKNYTSFLRDFSADQKDYRKQMAEARSKSDSLSVQEKIEAANAKLIAYRRDLIKNNPNTLLSTLLLALQMPDIPKGDHFLADGKTKDSTFAAKYFKAHYWDGYNFEDERLIHSPILDAKLDEYMYKMTLRWPDSVEKEADMLIKKGRASKENFKYVLWWLTRYAESSKIMGMDEVFVYLVENYYMKGDAFWLNNEELGRYFEKVSKISPNVLGNIAPEITLPDVFTKKDVKLSEHKAKYTLVVFYSPDCSHCAKEIPLLDSLYETVLKDKGVKVFTISTEGDADKIAEFIYKHKLENWTNTFDPNSVGDWRTKYDVFSTPTIYLLDERKIIRGKRLDHTNILNVLEFTEKRAANRYKK